jgi:hypothetical protein
MSIPALNAGVYGINQGLNNMRRDASAVAQAINSNSESGTSERPVDVADALVNLKMDTLQVQASGKVVETVHDILGSLLDVTA